MPLFVCPECGTIENTALATVVMDRGRTSMHRVCSACGPGGWHGRFPRETYNADRHGPLDDAGFIESRAS